MPKGSLLFFSYLFFYECNSIDVQTSTKFNVDVKKEMLRNLNCSLNCPVLQNGGRLFFIGQLSACSINIFTTAAAHPYIYPVFGKMIGKQLRSIFIGLNK